MKRITVCSLALLAIAFPARASTVSGHIDTAVATPTIPRTVYMTVPGSNGLTGYVARIASSTVERSYSLARTAGTTREDDLDAWFYRDIDGTGEPCPRAAHPDGDGGETGKICPGAAWVVVVLFAGANVDFTLTY